MTRMVYLPLQFTCFNKILICDGYLRDDRLLSLDRLVGAFAGSASARPDRLWDHGAGK